MTTDKPVLGLQKNWKQFSILVLVNAFVGGMVGLERSILPQFAETKFDITSHTAILSFIIAFGFTKAITNYFAGKWSNSFGRKKLLIVGWLFALPVPFLLILAKNWNWVLVANVFLGISQGLTWSSTIIMKIDLVGPKNRGFAMGLNEFSGYISVGIVAFISGWIASNYGVSPYPFYLGVAIAFMGLITTILFVKDTGSFVNIESKSVSKEQLKNVFIETSFKNKALSSITFAGLVNNLNDGMIWGLLPIFLLSQNNDTTSIAMIAGLYPTVWGIGQLFTGKMADHFSIKKMLVIGMLLQAIAIIALPSSSNFTFYIIIAVVLGIGTALVYPTFFTAIACITPPIQRAESIGTFRLWRDLGYVFGAIISGTIADVFGLSTAIVSIGIITLISAIQLKIRLPQILPH